MDIHEGETGENNQFLRNYFGEKAFHFDDIRRILEIIHKNSG